jgi:hypothetical protein
MKRTNLILLALLVVVSLAAVYPAVSSAIAARLSKPAGVPFGLAAYTAKTTTAVAITAPGTEPVDLHRDGSAWKVASYSASPDAVDGLFAALSQLRLGDVVSSNPANFGELGVADGNAVSLTLTGPAGKKTLLIGAAAPGFDDFYVRLPGAGEAVTATGGLHDAVPTTVSAWRDKTVINPARTTITKLAVSGPKTFTVIRGKDAWTVTAGTKKADIPSAGMDGIIAALSPLTANGFVDGPAKLSEFGRAKKLHVELSADNGPQASFSAVLVAADYWVEVPGQPQLFSVGAYVLDTLFALGDRAK